MNPVRLYWKSRLNDACVFYDTAAVREGVDYRGDLPWPKWVSRAALFDDFQTWFEREYAPNNREGAVDSPYLREAVFLKQVNKYLYGPFMRHVTSTFPVKVRKFKRGRWLVITEYHRFVRLMSHADSEARYLDFY